MILIEPQSIPPEDLDAYSVLISSDVAETDAGESEWASGTSYDVGDIVSVLGNTQRRYESLIDYNQGNDPVDDDGTNWLDLGATNRWRMFDGGSSTRTTNADTIEVTIQGSGIVNGIAAFNVEAQTAQVIVTDATDGEVYNETVSLTDNSNVSDWYFYFFDPVVYTRDFVLLDLPVYQSSEIEVIFDNTGADAECGLLILGNQRPLGTTLYGSSVSIRDYSRKETDDFGNFTVLQRRFSKLVDYDVVIDPSRVTSVQQTLARLRATPAVYIGNQELSETIVYGYYRDFNINLANFAQAEATIEVEGL